MGCAVELGMELGPCVGCAVELHTADPAWMCQPMAHGAQVEGEAAPMAVE